MTKTESVTPLALAIGDLVIESGVTLRIVSENQRWTDRDTGREVVNFRTEYVDGEVPWADVQGWMVRGEFNIQGNELARVCRVVA